jgi:hypothetical protein
MKFFGAYSDHEAESCDHWSWGANRGGYSVHLPLGNHFHVRIDRWSGDVVGCNAENQIFLTANREGFGVRFQCSELTDEEMKQNRVNPNRR